MIDVDETHGFHIRDVRCLVSVVPEFAAFDVVRLHALTTAASQLRCDVHHRAEGALKLHAAYVLVLDVLRAHGSGDRANARNNERHRSRTTADLEHGSSHLLVSLNSNRNN